MKTLVVVDIQPAYASRWPNVAESMEYINNHTGIILETLSYLSMRS